MNHPKTRSLLINSEYDQLSQLFKMFSDPTRLKIFTVLAQGECQVTRLSLILEMSQSAISHQLAQLRKMRLVKTRRSGKNIYYSLDDSHVMEIFQQALNHIRE